MKDFLRHCGLLASVIVMMTLFAVGCSTKPIKEVTLNQDINNNKEGQTNTNFTSNSDASAVTDGQGDANVDNWLTYTNEEYGFSLRYPPYATIEELGGSGTIGSGLSSVVIADIYYLPEGSVYPHYLSVHYLSESSQTVINEITSFDAELFPTTQETVIANGIDRVQITGPTAELSQLLQIISFNSGTLLLRGVDDKESHPEHETIMNSFRFLNIPAQENNETSEAGQSQNKINWKTFNSQKESGTKTSFGFEYPQSWIHFGSIDGGAFSNIPFYESEKYSKSCETVNRVTSCEQEGETAFFSIFGPSTEVKQPHYKDETRENITIKGVSGEIVSGMVESSDGAYHISLDGEKEQLLILNLKEEKRFHFLMKIQGNEDIGVFDHIMNSIVFIE